MFVDTTLLIIKLLFKKNEIHCNMLDTWANLGSDLKGFQQNPQTNDPLSKPEANVAHRVHNTVSPKITYGGLHDLGVRIQGRDWDCILLLFLTH